MEIIKQNSKMKIMCDVIFFVVPLFITVIKIRVKISNSSLNAASRQVKRNKADKNLLKIIE